jgi:hypothetical protein
MGSDHQEILGVGSLILCRHDIAVTRHVGLAVSNVNMEIGVRSRIGEHRAQKDATKKPE